MACSVDHEEENFTCCLFTASPDGGPVKQATIADRRMSITGHSKIVQDLYIALFGATAEPADVDRWERADFQFAKNVFYR